MVVDTEKIVEKVGLPDYLYDLDQIGVICADIDKATAAMKHLFDWEPDVTFERNFPWYYRGSDTPEEEMKAKICMYRNRYPVEIEFIQPKGGRSAWQDYLDMGQFGLHHIRFNVDDFEGAFNALQEKGLKVWATGPGTGPEGLRSAYFDTLDTLGFAIEVINWHEVQDKAASEE